MRIAVLGATGALGSELLSALDESRLGVESLVPIATDDSLGMALEVGGHSFAIETELASLRGADLLFLCAPVAASLEAVRFALRERIATIDCSGALADSPDVPLALEPASPLGGGLDAPLLAIPTGAVLACARVLAPIATEAGLERVVATVLESASAAGRGGVEALSEETIALLSQRDLPDPPSLGHPVAFDVLPWRGEIDDAGTSRAEAAFLSQLSRALGAPRLAATIVRAPVFCGEGVSLAVETREPIDAGRAAELLAKAGGIETGQPAPTTRAVAGSDEIHVGRLRRDPSCPAGLLLWLAADGLRLTAAHAVRVAEARFGRI